MEKQDLEIFNDIQKRVTGIELIDKDDFVLCLIHFNNQLDSEKFYYLLYKYDFEFLYTKTSDLNYKLGLRFKILEDMLVSYSDRNTINYKPLKSLINYNKDLYITTGIILTDGNFLEIGKHIKVKNINLDENKIHLN